MNLSIKMASDSERQALVEAFSTAIEADGDYSSLRAVMAQLIASGSNPLGLNCTLLQLSTIKLVRGKLQKKGNKVNMNAAFSSPICLN